MSAMEPAGSVKRKNGAAAAVAISESKSDEAPRLCINHVAAMSCAETNVPDNTLASHRLRNTGFPRANQVDVDAFSMSSDMKIAASLQAAIPIWRCENG
jgi:hypothetical protein